MIHSCIYYRCESDKPFPSEHVMPRSFGRFTQNLTIHCVCGNCNNFFGGHLEIRFSRDTGEGLVRYQHGLRNKPASSHPTARLTATITTRGPLFGSRVGFMPNSSGVGMDYVFFPQVGFVEPNSEDCHWFTEDRLNLEALSTIRFGAQVKFLSADLETAARLRAKLIDLGFKFGKTLKVEEISPQTKMDARIRWLFDSTIRRCIAKIAFNHLAYISDQRCDFLLRPEFDEIREYIRFGTPLLREESSVVVLNGEADLGFAGPPPLDGGHLLVTAWDTLNQTIVSQLSIFGALTYRARLCRLYHGVWFDIRGGHYFDLGKREIRGIRITQLGGLALP